MRYEYEPYLSRKPWDADSLACIGFFDDGLTKEELDRRIWDDRWVTPTHHLKPEGVVLCTTGAFSPFHAGHLRMLEIARAEIESRGLTVAGALVQPDHDGYVSAKRGGTCACPAAERIHLAQEALKDHPWVQVDPWPSLYQDRALNYTTILWRTQRYLGPLYRTVYVFGSDNADFKEAFWPDEYVCVGRPGSGETHPDALDLSSTAVRQPRVWPTPTFQSPYLYRDDLDWAVAPWGDHPRATTVFWAAAQAALCDAVQATPRVIETERQQEALAKLKDPYVNFDRVTGGPHWVSRVFAPMSLQDRPARFVSSDLSAIPAGKHAFVDDDIASGSTVKYVRSQTPQVEWTDMVTLVEPQHKGPYHDIVDARDFLFGSRCGGLLTTEGFRVPYILPWVNLWSRAKIPPSRQVAFTKAICEANVAFHHSVGTLVKDTENAAFWHKLGFEDGNSMAYVSHTLSSWL